MFDRNNQRISLNKISPHSIITDIGSWSNPELAMSI